MTDISAGNAAEFADPGRKVIAAGGIEVGVFHLGGQFYAWENACPHLDGPVCQGKILPCALEDVQPDKSSGGRVFSKTAVNIVCPWHGFEFDIRTGQHPADKRVRLRKIAVKVVGGEVMVSLPKPRG